MGKQKRRQRLLQQLSKAKPLGQRQSRNKELKRDSRLILKMIRLLIKLQKTSSDSKAVKVSKPRCTTNNLMKTTITSLTFSEKIDTNSVSNPTTLLLTNANFTTEPAM